jgi:4-amino-4-deoxy-L-arabinose transferase-like glycosyltransferase
MGPQPGVGRHPHVQSCAAHTRVRVCLGPRQATKLRPVNPIGRRSWLIACGLLAAIAVAIRVNNAFLYPLHYGFDAPANWEYIHQLMSDWTMPAPGEGWSTSHPPFFYYLAAFVGRMMGEASKFDVTVANRLLSSAIGLLGIWAAYAFVRRYDPERPWRALLAAALLAFLPVHLYMSSMLGEEIIAASLTSLVLVGAAFELVEPSLMRRGMLKMAGLGVLAGLAFLTKLTGLLVVAAVVAAFCLEALRKREFVQPLSKALLFGVIAVVIGGWPYLRNQVEYGYFYPQNLQVHEIMFTMPPGERGLADYLRFPIATFSDPQVLSPDLWHSVWGTTYQTLWFDGHRIVLPRSDPGVARVGTTLLVLGLIPTLAFFWGVGRGVRRFVHSFESPDALMLAMIALTLAGYLLFTFKNPWYATLKASYMLGICVPFAYYTSEVLADALSPRRPWLAGLVAAPLAALLVTSGLVFSVDLVYEKKEGPGFVWPKVDPSRHQRNAIPNQSRAKLAP